MKSMKKILITLVICLGSSLSFAQSGSITLTNTSTTDTIQVRPWATDGTCWNPLQTPINGVILLPTQSTMVTPVYGATGNWSFVQCYNISTGASYGSDNLGDCTPAAAWTGFFGGFIPTGTWTGGFLWSY